MSDLSYENVASKKQTEILCFSCKENYLIYEKLNLPTTDLIIKTIDVDLQIQYYPHNTLGFIIPLLYDVLVCPVCLFVMFKTEMDHLDELEFDEENLSKSSHLRLNIKSLLFSGLSFNHYWTIEHGILAYILIHFCYNYKKNDHFLSIHKGIAFLRAHWLLKFFINFYSKKKEASSFEDELKKLSSFLLNMAMKYYHDYYLTSYQVKDHFLMQKKNLGPDNYNWHFLGFQYLTAYFFFIKSLNKNLKPNERIDFLKKSRKIIDNLFSFLSKGKPLKSIVILKRYCLMIKEKINQNLENLGTELK